MAFKQEGEWKDGESQEGVQCHEDRTRILMSGVTPHTKSFHDISRQEVY